MDKEYYRKRMHDRLDGRLASLTHKVVKQKRLVDRGKIGGEEDRMWLDAQVKGLGDGLDICCGDFLIQGSEGVDGDLNKFGPIYSTISGDELTNQQNGSLDFIVTNYIEAFPNVLKVLNDWMRVLKPGGLLAFICVRADHYNLQDPKGPLSNPHRLSLFNEVTITQYLSRAEFVNITVEHSSNNMLRVKAYRKEEGVN